jgi:hypothetical protein
MEVRRNGMYVCVRACVRACVLLMFTVAPPPLPDTQMLTFRRASSFFWTCCLTAVSRSRYICYRNIPIHKTRIVQTVWTERPWNSSSITDSWKSLAGDEMAEARSWPWNYPSTTGHPLKYSNSCWWIKDRVRLLVAFPALHKCRRSCRTGTAFHYLVNWTRYCQ